MLNKENYVPWSSRLLRYAKSRPNGKLIHNSILNGPYVRRMIPEPGDANRKNQIENGNLVAARAEGNLAGKNGNQIRCYNCRGVGHYVRNCTVRPRRRDAAYLQTELLIAQKEEAGIQLQAEEYDLMVAAVDLDEIEEVNANCILMANLQQASTSGTQTDSAPVYDIDGSVEDTSVEQGGETVEQHPANFEETPIMASLVDKAILSGAENRPPMLEKDMYDSWRSRMEMYMLNRQHGRIILESVEHGPLLWPSVTEEGLTRLKK
nr:Gag-Pol polyprotein [Tanacetum cinerariifolium]